MNRQYLAFFALILTLFILSIATGDNPSPSAAPDDYGQAVVEKILRVDLQCRIFCDIQNWPPIIAKEIPIQIRGLDAQQPFDIPTRQFILETLTAAMNPNPPAADSDPNQPPAPKVLLKHIQRGQTFCLVADVEINGQDLAQMLVDKGYAKKIIIPNGVSAAPVSSQSSSPGGFVASKSGKVFHKSACPHAKRIQDNTKVTYRTRDEAINAGKRPCQTCNP